MTYIQMLGAKISMHEIKLSLDRIGRSLECENSERIDSFDVAVWPKAADLLKSRVYSHGGCIATIETDWNPVVQEVVDRAARSVEFREILAEKGDLNRWFEERKDEFGKDLEVLCQVELKGENKFTKYRWYPSFFVERYIYDVFTIMNFSVPGSCDFLNVKLLTGLDHELERRKELSSYNFEEGLSLSLEGQSPRFEIIPIDEVLNWYEKLDVSLKQKAETSIEKALFSLFHICKLDGELTSVIWIFHALESLYSTRVGEGFTNLFKRISKLLELNEKEQGILKKNLRKLYEHRSSIVHGGYQVHHPEGTEVIDRRLDDDISMRFKLNQYGFGLVACSIQKLIKNGWYGVKIEESLLGLKQP